MKLGLRTPSIKKSLSARTTGKLKRSVKKSINPFSGKKGIGIFTDPKKSIYNKVYNKTTFDGFSSIKNKTYDYQETEYAYNNFSRRCIQVKKNDDSIFVPVGFEQGVFFVGALVPLSRKDYINFIKIILLQFIFFKAAGFSGGVFLSIIVNIIYSFQYNKIYLKKLLKKGYLIVE
ncbi:MAG: hypothetical protein ACRCXX_09745 [Cetobacterium sp.]|uniref:hypothetical protein n=1 Tax=Cetobacterium sp. TaxID=2071632 RepID=UPI003F38684E